MPTQKAAGAEVDVTLDALWRGRLPLWQPARNCGYRFNLDSVLLADFVAAEARARALELGAGCGIIGLMLLAEGKVSRLVAVERQPQLAELLRRNVAAYGWQETVQVMAGDLRQLRLAEADLVVFNPPYFAAAAGRPSAEPGRDAGRRECHGTLADFVRCGSGALRRGGRLVAIVPYGRRHELRAMIAANGLQLVRQRAIQALPAAAPRHLMVDACKGDAQAALDVQILPPLLVHRPGGGYTEEVQRLIDGPAAWQGPPPCGADRLPSGG